VDFGWTEEQQATRAAVRAFVEGALPDWWDATTHTVTGGDRTSAWCRTFAPQVAAAGWLTPHWPTEFGGRDASAWELLIISEEMWAHGEPRGCQYMNVNWIGPAIMRFGDDDQRAEHLPPMAAGTVRWCQGFSEPDAGSDLAAVRTSAIRDGDDYVVNGSKIWTSYAGEADHCFLVVRTDPESKGRQGISVLLVPMGSPGLVVRPIPAVVGEHAFHEVVFTDVRVPARLRLGEEHDGWQVVTAALGFERVGAPRYARALRALDLLAAELARRGQLDDPLVLARLGDALGACEAARLLAYAVVDERARGEAASTIGNVLRVAVAAADQQVAECFVDLLGPEALFDASPGVARFGEGAPATVAAGTTEVQLDLIARRRLDLGGPRPAGR
jgi:alkylation response protein AidB-like acyl-CoA dehydrogenase